MLSRRLKAVRPKGASRRTRTPLSSRAGTSPAAPVRGVVVGWQRDRGVLIEVPGAKAPLLAQSLVELTDAELDEAAARRRIAMLVFENGDRARPVIVGLLAPIPGKAKGAARGQAGQKETLVADDVVMIRGRDSIEIRCGAASITLQKDGHILVRGKTLTSRASKENRIMGGSVHFN